MFPGRSINDERAFGPVLCYSYPCVELVIHTRLFRNTLFTTIRTQAHTILIPFPILSLIKALSAILRFIRLSHLLHVSQDLQVPWILFFPHHSTARHTYPYPILLKISIVNSPSNRVQQQTGSFAKVNLRTTLTHSPRRLITKTSHDIHIDRSKFALRNYNSLVQHLNSSSTRHIMKLKPSYKLGFTMIRAIENSELGFFKHLYSTTTHIDERIREQIRKSPVVVYMKGTPTSPACGFSRAIVEVLKRENISHYDYYNILEDDQLRQGIKQFSNWPTIPQVYIGGEFLGGCDIILEMHQDGSLNEALEKVGCLINKQDNASTSTEL